MSFPGWWPYRPPSSVAAYLTTSSVKVGNLKSKHDNDFQWWSRYLITWFLCWSPQATISPPWGRWCRYNTWRLSPCVSVFCAVPLWVVLHSVQSVQMSSLHLDHSRRSGSWLFSFVPLLVFLHGCGQCVYPSSVWQHDLPLGCSICICHHGPHHLQSQVSAQPMDRSSHCVSHPETGACFSREI